MLQHLVISKAPPFNSISNSPEMERFVSERLVVEQGAIEMVGDLYDEFLAENKDTFNTDSYTISTFGTDLAKIIQELKGGDGTSEWKVVSSRNGRKKKSVKHPKGMLYDNLVLQDWQEPRAPLEL